MGLKKGWNFDKKCYLLFKPLITPGTIFFGYWCHIKTMTCGCMVNVKNVDFDVEFSALMASFPRKSLNFFGILNFKAPKVPLITRMRVYSEKQKGRFFIELQLCFSEYTRIRGNKGTSRAFKLKNRYFRMNFCWKLLIRQPITHQNPHVSPLLYSHI